jgi:predicted RNase H-like HicB family nuclease
MDETQFEAWLMAASNSYTAIYKQDGDSWIGWIEEVPGVNAQEKTKDELLASLKVILQEALEFNREDARKAAEADYTEEPIMI